MTREAGSSCPRRQRAKARWTVRSNAMSISGPDVLLYERKGRKAIITLNRPERMNAMSIELMERLAETWQRYRDDDDAWVAIVTGAGERAFSSGADLREPVGSRRKMKYSLEQTVPTGCEGLWKPVIAAIQGYAVGGGWYLAQNCDIRVAARNAQFAVNEAKRGLAANWIVSLTRYLPLSAALEITLTGKTIGAERALELGFINKVVDNSRVLEEAETIADEILECGPLAVRCDKEILMQGLTMSYAESVEFAKRKASVVWDSEDAKEGIQAFLEKRKPQWRNK